MSKKILYAAIVTTSTLINSAICKADNQLVNPTGEYNGYSYVGTKTYLETAIKSTSNSTMTMNGDMNIRSVTWGVDVGEGANLSILGKTGNESINISDADTALLTRGDNNNTLLSINDMNINLDSNIKGISAYLRGTAVITGKTDGSQSINFTNTIMNTDNKTSIEAAGTLNINNMDINFTDDKSTKNLTVLNILNRLSNYTLNGNVHLKSSDVKQNVFSISGNEVGTLIGMDTTGDLVSDNMNYVFSGNNADRMYFMNGHSSVSNFNGDASKNNYFEFSNNTGKDVQFFFLSRYNQLYIKDMNIIFTGNEATGILRGMFVDYHEGWDMESSTGNHYFNFNNNKAGGNITGISGGGEFQDKSPAWSNFKGMNFNISNNDAGESFFGISMGNTNIIGGSNRNTITFYDNTSGAGYYAAGMLLEYGVNSVKDMDIFVRGNDFALLSNMVGNGNTTFDNTIVTIEDDSRAFVTPKGSSVVNLNNKTEINTNGGAFWDVTGSSSNGTINVDDSNISGFISTVDGKSNLNLANGSIWNIVSNSKVTNLSLDNSTINMRSDSLMRAPTYNTLTMSNFSGNNGSIYMNTFLGGDTSPTDKIIIDNGTATGTTQLYINETGNSGVETMEGINVVQAINSTLDPTSFTLYGGQLDTGPYVYKLYQGDISGNDTQGFYLRNNGATGTSQLQLSHIAHALANEPAAIMSAMRSGMNELMKRMGELREDNPEHKNGLWIRGHGRSLHLEDKLPVKMNVYGVEAGYDQKFDLDDAKLFAGLAFGYTYVDRIRNVTHNAARDGEGIGRAPSIGVYGTWLHKNGFYVDGIIRNFWSDLDLSNYSSTGVPVRYSPDRYITAYSLEAGKQLKYCIDDNSMWIFEPRVEFMYAHAEAKSFRSNLGTHIRYGDTNSYTGKIGLMAGYKTYTESGMAIEPYIKASLIQEWHAKTNVTYDNAKYRSDLKGGSYEFGGGLNMKLNDSNSFYAEVMYEDGSKIQSLSGNIGFRYTW